MLIVCNASRKPGFVIIPILDPGCMFCHQKRTESVYHDRQFVGFFYTDAFFHSTGMRAMRDAARMECDHATFDVLAAHKIAIYIVQHLIRVNVGVVVGGGYGQRVVVEQAGYKGTDHEIMTIERLVYGRWLVYPPSDRLEIVDTERVRIDVPIPAHHIKRMAQITVWINIVLLFDVKQELAPLIVGLQIGRFSDVAFTIRRMFEQLAEGIAVALGRRDRAGAFHDEKAVVGGVKLQLIDRATRNHQVVAIFEAQVAIHRPQSASALVNENHLVCVRVFVKIIGHALSGSREDDFAVVVDQNRFTGAQVIIFRLNLEPIQTPVFQLLVMNGAGCNIEGFSYLNNLCRRMTSVEQGIQIIETFSAEQLF